VRRVLAGEGVEGEVKAGAGGVRTAADGRPVLERLAGRLGGVPRLHAVVTGRGVGVEFEVDEAELGGAAPELGVTVGGVLVRLGGELAGDLSVDALGGHFFPSFLAAVSAALAFLVADRTADALAADRMRAGPNRTRAKITAPMAADHVHPVSGERVIVG
jgi:hypothetical protein